MSPEEMTATLERMLAGAKDVPATMEEQARAVAGKVHAPGVGVAVGRSGNGIVVRVLSTNPRASSRQVAARIKPTLVRAVAKGIEGCVRA